MPPPAKFRPGFRVRAAWLALLCLLAPAFTARAQATREYDLKAVLLYNLTHFTDWPPETAADAAAPWVIGILGRDPFGKVLDDVVKTETHLNRRFVVERYRDLPAVMRCHILFVSGGSMDELPRILAAVKGRPILCVGDAEAFALRGGMIAFKKNPDGRIRLSVNLPAIRDAGLKVSAKLLRAAEVVTPPPP